MNDILAKLLPTVATALGGPLAGGLVSWIANKVGVSSEDTSTIADAISGMDPAKRLELEIAASQWTVAEYNKLTVALMADVQDARARDAKYISAGTRNYRADCMFVLAVALVTGMVWIVWKDPGLNEFAKGIFTLALGRFLGYLDNIYNFEFGSTRTSKAKDETINKLSKTTLD